MSTDTTTSLDFNVPIEQVILTLKRGMDLVTELGKSGTLEPWYLDLWQNLISEFLPSYMTLQRFVSEKNMSASAWMARNLLELMVWVIYCVKSRDGAKRFYDDKVRDVFDFLDQTELLVKMSKKPEVVAETLISETRDRVADLAVSWGV
jgi:hypothetical protein